MIFKEKDAVLYIPQHIAKDKKLPQQLPELRNHRDVEKGTVVDVNEPSQLVFVLFTGDMNAKACRPQDLHLDPAVEREGEPTPTPTPTTTKPGETVAQSTAATAAGAGPAASKS